MWIVSVMCMSHEGAQLYIGIVHISETKYDGIGKTHKNNTIMQLVN